MWTFHWNTFPEADIKAQSRDFSGNYVIDDMEKKLYKVKGLNLAK